MCDCLYVCAHTLLCPAPSHSVPILPVCMHVVCTTRQSFGALLTDEEAGIDQPRTSIDWSALERVTTTAPTAAGGSQPQEERTSLDLLVHLPASSRQVRPLHGTARRVPYRLAGWLLTIWLLRAAAWCLSCRTGRATRWPSSQPWWR